MDSKQYQLPEKNDIFAKLARLWGRAQKPVIVSAASLAVICIALGVIFPWPFWPLAMVAVAVLWFIFLGWIVSFIWAKISKDTTQRKKVKVFLITIAIIVLPGSVILPIAGGMSNYIRNKNDEKKYRQCIKENTPVDSKVLPGRLDPMAYKCQALNPLFR